MLINVE